jgi:hypothetical protein
VNYYFLLLPSLSARICPQAQVLPWCAASDEDLLTAILDRATEGEREHKTLYTHAVFAQYIASRYYRREREARAQGTLRLHGLIVVC